MGYTLSACERETHIWWDESTDTAVLYTCSTSLMRKMDKLCESSPDLYQEDEARAGRLDGEVISREYHFPKDLLTFRSAFKKIELTEEQKEERRARLALAHAAKQAARERR